MTAKERVKAYQDLCDQYLTLKERAQTHQNSVLNRARRLAYAAGLKSADLVFLHLHNAWAQRNTNPWPNVDYEKLYVARTVYNRRFDANRIIEDWFTRKLEDLRHE